jgi:hypothetical protein
MTDIEILNKAVDAVLAMQLPSIFSTSEISKAAVSVAGLLISPESSVIFA